MDRRKKIETELIRILATRHNGSVLSRFQDWSASRSPDDIEHGLRFLGRNSAPLQIVRRKRSNVVGIPKR
jgi:hypothetical protein